MAEHTTSDQLASKAVDFQATAEAYYSIAVEKVKDVRYVAGFVSISQLAFTVDMYRIVKQSEAALYYCWAHLLIRTAHA